MTRDPAAALDSPTLRVHWVPVPGWPTREAAPLSIAFTSRMVKRFWGPEWESNKGRRITLNFTHVAYLNGLSDGGDDDTTRDAQALIEAIHVYGEVILDLRDATEAGRLRQVT